LFTLSLRFTIFGRLQLAGFCVSPQNGKARAYARSFTPNQ